MNPHIIELELGKKQSHVLAPSPVATPSPGLPGELKGALLSLIKSFYNSSLSAIDDLHGIRARLEGVWPSAKATNLNDALPSDLASALLLLGEAWSMLPRWVRERDDHFCEMVQRLASSLLSAGRGSQQFHEKMTAATSRLQQISTLSDLREIKSRIVQEAEIIARQSHEHQEMEKEARGQLLGQVQKLQREVEMAEERAALDPLTRAANRGSLDTALARWTRRAAAEKGRFVVGLFDIDNFKAINDTFGHPVGDRVLIAAVKAMRGVVRASDMVARFGGEEFAVLMDGVTLEQAAEKFSTSLREMAAVSYEFERDGLPHRLSFTASCGVTEFSPKDKPEDVLARADAALYDAKRWGKNRVEIRRASALQSLFRKVRGV